MKRARARPAKLWTAHGHTMTVAQWSAHLGVPELRLRQRLKKDLALEDVFTNAKRSPGRSRTRLRMVAAVAFRQWITRRVDPGETA